MTTREWVTLLYFFGRQSHQSWPTDSECHCFISLAGSSYFTPWPTESEWHCFIPFCLINYVLSHDEQNVGDTASFLCQAVSSIMSPLMTNSMWVTLLYFFARHSHQQCFIPWPTGSEWHCFISLLGSLINDVLSHDQQYVSDTALFLCQQSCLISWPTVCEWHYFISLPGTLINNVSSPDQQEVSDTALFLCQALSSIMSHPMTNRQWVTWLYSFDRQSHQIFPWWTDCMFYAASYQTVSLPLILWSIVSQWYAIFASHFFHITQSVRMHFVFHQKIPIPWLPTASE